MIHPPRRNLKGMPWGLLGMFALVVLVERFVAQNGACFSTPANSTWRQAGQASLREAAGCDLLCFGDSQLKFGLVAKVLESRTGWRSYNLALAGGRPPSTYYLLRRALSAEKLPAAVLVDFNPEILLEGFGESLRPWAELLDTRESLDLTLTTGNPRFFGETTMARLFPTIKDRAEIRANLKSALDGKGKADAARVQNRSFVRNARTNAGSLLIPATPGARAQFDKFARNAFEKKTWTPHRISVTFLRRFLDLAASKNVRVYWVMPPLAPPLQAKRDSSGLEGILDEYLLRLQDRYSNLTILDGRHTGYARDVYFDPVHLDRRGAVTFSLDVGETLRRIRSGSLTSRWVNLSPYRPRQADMPLEDINESRLALKQERSR